MVYRCTYGDDEVWQKALQMIHRDIRKGMQFYGGDDMLAEDRFRLTVLEDADALDGATTHTIRQHFKTWCSTALEREQGTPPERAQRIINPNNPSLYSRGQSVRYTHCLQMTSPSLRSILSPDDSGWVNLISATWEPKPPPVRAVPAEGEVSDEYDEEVADEELENESSEGFPEIEGCEQLDVGVMRVRCGVWCRIFYDGLSDRNYWGLCI